MHDSTSKADAVASALRQGILSGRWQAGERLPSERDLATRYSTTRGAVREALRGLEQLGLAQVQPGGARVQPLEQASPDIIGLLLDQQAEADPALLDQVLAVMAALMGLAMHQAIEHASDAELDVVLHHLQRVCDARDPAVRLQARMDLGAAVMTASHNLVLRLLANSLRLQLHDRYAAVLEARMPPPPADLSERLAAAIRGRDAETAVSVLRAIIRHGRMALADTPSTTNAAAG